MGIVETYLFLLVDSFMTGLVLPVKEDLVFTAMRVFGGYNLYLASALATIGVTLSACLNWLLGRVLLSLKKHVSTPANNLNNKKVLNLLQTYGHYSALFSFVPILGPILVLFTGVVQSKFSKVITLVFIANLVWRIARFV